jgi:hypothetical protein
METSGFSNPNGVAVAYRDLLAKFHFNGFDGDRPYSDGTVVRALRSGRFKKLDCLDLAIYLIRYGEEDANKLLEHCGEPNGKLGKWAYEKISAVVSSDSEILRLKQLINSSDSSSETEIDASIFGEKFVAYSLLSSRIADEPAESGTPAQSVIGFMEFDGTGGFEGEAFIFFGSELALKKNGNLRSVEPIFSNSRGTFLLEYKLERQHLPDNPDDREGFIKVKQSQMDGTIFTEAAVFSGTYKDLDTDGANVPGQAYLELFEKSSDSPKTILEQNAESFLGKMK